MEEKGDRGQKECHKDVIRSNERKSKMPVSVKGEWKKGLREKEGRGGSFWSCRGVARSGRMGG